MKLVSWIETQKFKQSIPSRSRRPALSRHCIFAHTRGNRGPLSIDMSWRFETPRSCGLRQGAVLKSARTVSVRSLNLEVAERTLRIRASIRVS